MREIKFRAWDLQDKKMWHFDLFDIRSNQDCDGYDGVYIYDNDGNELCLNSFIYGDNPDVTIMQYTGIKDKKGVEIYEGDILHDGGMRAVVEFDDGSFIYEWADPINDGQHKFHICDHVRESLEVIGNIYENPELLRIHEILEKQRWT